MLTPLNWPAEAVQLDGHGRALILLTLPAASIRPVARQHARQALRQIAASLFGCAADEIGLRESPQGPVFEGIDKNIGISLSYAADRCLIGLCSGGRIGVDIVKTENYPEIETLSRLYLPEAACRDILAAPMANRAERFALGWAEMEARSKCLGLPLEEISPQRERTLNACEIADCNQTGDFRIAFANAFTSARST